ncbi:MAG: helix-turn-helix domain-containing protein, partial [Clostridiales bacterium]|nr:helix-turn-helix domain-containing protein [Clostridiales bacterium]
MRHFTDEEKSKAIEMYFMGNSTTQDVVDLLGYPTRQCLEIWLRKDPRYKNGNFRHGFYPLSVKLEVIRLLHEEGLEPTVVAEKLGVKNVESIYNWARKYAEGGGRGLMPKKKVAQEGRHSV